MIGISNAPSLTDGILQVREIRLLEANMNSATTLRL